MTHVRKEVERTLTSDFVCGPTTSVIFLSLQYHGLHPAYVYTRVRELGRTFRLRVLLVLADTDAHQPAVRELTTLALIHDLALVIAGSPREAARYLETFRSFDGKAPDAIQANVEGGYPERLHAALASVRGVNKRDVGTLAFTFGSFRGIASAGEESLKLCPGLGDTKVARLYSAFNQPFKTEGDKGKGEGSK